jgi:sugar fermentation stimulation protein A
MKYHAPLKDGLLLKRYKRFFADFSFENSTFVAHVANSGSMKGCSDPNSACRFLEHTSSTRKIPYSLEMVKTKTSWVGVNTMRPNQLIWDAWEAKLFPHWRGFDRAQKEVRIHDKSRLDMVLWESKHFPAEKLQKHDFSKTPPHLHLVEIKNVSMAESGRALFPDSITERGQKHLRDLMNAVQAGHTAELIFVIQREDCTSFGPADAIDPEYGKLLRQAAESGVEINAYACNLSHVALELSPKKLKIAL